MKKIMLVIAAVMIMPMFGVGAKEPVFDVGHLFYTNKTPFLLEGLVEPGSTVAVSGVERKIEVDKSGKFSVDLPLKEGVNLFSLVIDLEGTMTIKGVMVEMDTTPPEVTLLVKDKPTQDKDVKIDIYDALGFAIIGFTEPGCKILADDVDYSTDSVKFEAKFKVNKAPSRSDHKFEITDKFGNKTLLELKAVNAHIRTVVLQIGNPLATIDGKECKLSVPPTISRGTMMIPLRFIAVEAADGKLDYIKSTKTATIISKDKTITLIMDRTTVYINGKPIELKTAPPIIFSGSAVAPFRFIGEELGFIVTWYSESKTITMTKAIYK